MKNYTHEHFAAWDNAIKIYHLRNQAISTWKLDRIAALTGIRDINQIWKIEEEFDTAFAAILKKYPIKTILDFQCLEREAGISGYRNGYKADAYSRGKQPKQDALGKLILEIVRRNTAITKNELLQALKSKKGEGVIHDIDDIEISFGLENKALESAPLSGLKDRLSRAKAMLKKENNKKN